jgi:hypothetical protein
VKTSEKRLGREISNKNPVNNINWRRRQARQENQSNNHKYFKKGFKKQVKFSTNAAVSNERNKCFKPGHFKWLVPVYRNPLFLQIKRI